MELFEKFDAIMGIAETTSAEFLKPIICMLIDYTASKSGITSKELLEEITPVIIMCNEQLGQMEV